jgi:predicted DNA-binding WGR domain protein
LDVIRGDAYDPVLSQSGLAMAHLNLLLERKDAARNMARYYVLSIEPTLFCDHVLVREWGRIGATARRRHEVFASASDAQTALDTWLKRKRRRGYELRSLSNG